jgi:carbonic anhydrase
MAAVLSLLVAATAFTYSVQAGLWNYNATDKNWKKMYSECGYHRQSPIDVPIDPYTQCSQPLTLQWTSQSSQYVIRNNGHSLAAVPFTIEHAGGSDLSGLEILRHRNDTNVRLTNSFYNTYKSSVHKEYCFDSLHFHWGAHDGEGSEHTVNGQAFPLEVHLVHYSCNYDIAGDALDDYSTGYANYKYDDDNVLAVIGVMFEIGEANPVLEKILNEMIVEGIFEFDGHGEHDNVIRLYYTEFNPRDLLPTSEEMVAYLGSLTTPPCYQTVRWHLMKEKMTVSEDQMDRFRMLLTSHDINDSMAPNYRPIQPRNGRKIWQCQEDVDHDALYADTKTYGDEHDTDSETEHGSDGEHDAAVSSGNTALIVIGAISAVVVILVICCIARNKFSDRFSGADADGFHGHDEHKLSDHMAINQGIMA